MPHEFFHQQNLSQEPETGLPKANSFPKHGLFFPFSLILTIIAICFGVLLLLAVALSPYLLRLKNVYTFAIAGKNNIESAQNYVMDQNFSLAAENLNSAKTNFEKSKSALLDFEKLPLTDLSFISSQTTAINGLLDAGISISTALYELSDFGGQVLKEIDAPSLNFSQLDENQKKRILAKLYQAPPILQGAKAELSLALQNIETIPEQGVVSYIYDLVLQIKDNLEIVQNTLEEIIPLVQIAPQVSGFPNGITYLFLLQNNTEIRATGGFIGTYGILKVRNAEITDFKTDNVYNLDLPAKEYLHIPLPEPMARYLQVKEWFLRDSNWSPDFAESAQKALWFYQQEGGKEKPDGVIAITPTLVQGLLHITGEIEVDGIKFNENNFVEELEFEVEKAYLEKGKTDAERKEIIGDLADILMQKLMALDKSKWPEVFKIIENNIFERHVLLYFNDNNIQKQIENEDWSGKVKQTDGDYGMVIDTNLAALKTDAVMEKTINYNLSINEKNEVLGKIVVNYKNTGSFTWYTTRYRSYTRIYLPKGAELLKVEGAEKGSTSFYEELGKSVFGGFITIEPQKSKDLIIEYKLPQRIYDQIKAGEYNLLFQKQSGTIAHELNLNLDFKNNEIKTVIPQTLGTVVLGDNHISLTDDLRRDREFKVEFEQ